MKGWREGLKKWRISLTSFRARSLWETSSRLVRLLLGLLVVERVRDEKRGEKSSVRNEIEKGGEKRRRKEEKEVHSSGVKPSVYLLPTAVSFLFLHFVSFSSSLSLFLPLLSSPSPTLIQSQERVDRVAHTLLHRDSSGLERPRALHPLRHAALSKIQPFLGRSTNRRQLTTG